jgi:hypothetical protein
MTAENVLPTPSGGGAECENAHSNLVQYRCRDMVVPRVCDHDGINHMRSSPYGRHKELVPCDVVNLLILWQKRSGHLASDIKNVGVDYRATAGHDGHDLADFHVHHSSGDMA